MRVDSYGVMLYSLEKGWWIHSKGFSTKRKAQEFILDYRVTHGATQYRILAMAIESQNVLTD